MKFGGEVRLGPDSQGKNYFSPGGPPRGKSPIITEICPFPPKNRGNLRAYRGFSSKRLCYRLALAIWETRKG